MAAFNLTRTEEGFTLAANGGHVIVSRVADEVWNEIEQDLVDGPLYTKIERLDVEKNARRQGLGRALLRAAIAEARAAYGPGIKLVACPGEEIDLETLVRFYESEGFEIVEDCGGSPLMEM